MNRAKKWFYANVKTLTLILVGANVAVAIANILLFLLLQQLPGLPPKYPRIQRF